MNSSSLVLDFHKKTLETVDDMYCEECREPFVNPDLYCKHQCDDESYSCDYDGECVADNNGVMFLTIFVGINYIFAGKSVSM